MAKGELIGPPLEAVGYEEFKSGKIINPALSKYNFKTYKDKLHFSDIKELLKQNKIIEIEQEK